MNGMGMNGMGMNGMQQMYMNGMGGGMGGMGMNPMMGGMGGMGGMGMGGLGPVEQNLLQVIQSTGNTQSKMSVLLSQALVNNIVNQGVMAQIAQRSSCNIDLGVEVPGGLRQVTLCGTMAQNSLAANLLQQQAIQQNMTC